MHVKGSKRTYVDSQPGIFIRELQKLNVKNPVIVIDEIDKVGFNAMKGDVSSTLLELLNPEQANTFRDNYLDIEFDFSECIFVCTSNATANMLQPLLDRIEIIHVPAYLPIEKIKIAQRYLIPRFEREYGFTPSQLEETVGAAATHQLASTSEVEKIQVTDAALIKIINHYCGHEAGVRNLRKCLDRIFRKIVAKMEDKKITSATPAPLTIATETVEHVAPVSEAATSQPTLYKAELPEKVVKEYQVNSRNLERFLDVAPTDDNYYQGINQRLPIGSSNGLAYVDDGQGTVLKIQFVKREYIGDKKKAEAADKDGAEADTPSKGSGHLTHTGRLGETMKESVEVVKIAVFNFLAQRNLAAGFDKNSYHLHVPMGSIPKDGPSAGISLFTALVSIAIQKPAVPSLAMTGEITTLGEVIAIGGVREKLTACKNHQITQVILPLSNRKNVTKLPDEFKKGFTIFYVRNISQVHKICFDTDEMALADGSAFEELRSEHGIEIDRFEEDTLSNKILLDREEAELIANSTKRNCLEDLLQ